MRQIWFNFFRIFGQKFGGYFQMLLKLLPLVTTAVKSVSQPEIEIGQTLKRYTDLDTSCHKVVVKLVQDEDIYIY